MSLLPESPTATTLADKFRKPTQSLSETNPSLALFQGAVFQLRRS
jgi:hypothetical protein